MKRNNLVPDVQKSQDRKSSSADEMKIKEAKEHAENKLKSAIVHFEHQFGVKAELTRNDGPYYYPAFDFVVLKTECVIHGLSRIPAISQKLEGWFKYNEGFMTCYFDLFLDRTLVSRIKKGKRLWKFKHLEGIYDPSSRKWEMRWTWY